MQTSLTKKDTLKFTDTQTAFKHLSDFELKKTYWIYNLLSFDKMMKLGMKLLPLAVRCHFPMEFLIRKNFFEVFCGGETLEECRTLNKKLSRLKVQSTLDYAVEGRQNEEEFDNALHKILDSVYEASESKLPFAVFKVTALARSQLLEKLALNKPLSMDETNEINRVRERLHQISSEAANKGLKLLIDAEESWIQGGVDQLTEELIEKFNQKEALIYPTLQMYRTDRLKYLKTLHARAERNGYILGFKIVRGAYLEKERQRALDFGYPSPVFDSKKGTDDSFDAAILFCLQHLTKIKLFVGSHNEDSLLSLCNHMKAMEIASDDGQIYFSQLLGMCDHITFNLAARNYKVTKYVPFGPIKQTIPYLLRRAEENSGIQGQAKRQLELILLELNRRGL